MAARLERSQNTLQDSPSKKYGRDSILLVDKEKCTVVVNTEIPCQDDCLLNNDATIRL